MRDMFAPANQHELFWSQSHPPGHLRMCFPEHRARGLCDFQGNHSSLADFEFSQGWPCTRSIKPKFLGLSEERHLSLRCKSRLSAFLICAIPRRKEATCSAPSDDGSAYDNLQLGASAGQ